jgi:predicted GH43/DUF377 family glycosyl hydrolase
MWCRQAVMRAFGCVLVAIAVMALGPKAASADPGPGAWTKYVSNPVMDLGTAGSWDDGGVLSGSVLHDGSLYRMWYTGYRAGGPARIGYASSPDALTGTRYAGNPVLDVGSTGAWDADGVRLATVISDTGTLKMWYSGLDANQASRIGYATSADGIHWMKYGGNPVLDLGSAGSWEESSIGEASVIKDGGTYRMWYRGDPASGPSRIGYATSPDGIHWTKNAGNPVLSGAALPAWDWATYAPRAMLDGGTYRMWYSGTSVDGTTHEIGYATSVDGINWKKHGPVLTQGPDGSFDHYAADYATLLLEDGIYRLWYVGKDAAGHTRLGYATAHFVEPLFLPWLPNYAGR